MKHYFPTGRRNHGRPLKRLLDTWDRNGSTSGPTPWQIYVDVSVPYYYSIRYCSTCLCTLQYTILQYILTGTLYDGAVRFCIATVYNAAVQFYTVTLYDTAVHVSVPYCYIIRYCSTYFCTATLYDTAVHISVPLQYTILQYTFLYCYSIQYCSTCLCTATVYGAGVS